MVDWLGAARGRVLAPPALLLLVLAAAAPSPLRAEVPIGELGRVEQLPDPPGDHWIWVADPVLRRSALVDLDYGDSSARSTAASARSSRRRRRAAGVYVPETLLAREPGVRTDVLTIYDRGRLAQPARSCCRPAGDQRGAARARRFTDDDRFVAIFNLTPATSPAHVDLASRTAGGRIEIPGAASIPRARAASSRSATTAAS
jgi:hypothetical protein